MAEISRLPGPVADLWDWQLQGLCRRENPDVFFHPEGERGPARRNRDSAAKQVCATCPVLAQCRAQHLGVRPPAQSVDHGEHVDVVMLECVDAATPSPPETWKWFSQT